MEQILIRICIVFLMLSNIVLLVVITKVIDKVTLHHKLISAILNNLCSTLKEEDSEEE